MHGWGRSAWRVVAAGSGVAALVVPAWAGFARAGEGSSVRLFRLSASASGVGVVFDRKDLLPITPILDLGSPRVKASLSDAPASDVTASPFDPGALRVAGGAVATLVGLPFSPPSVPGTAVASYPTGDPESAVETALENDQGPYVVAAARASSAREGAHGVAAVGSLAGPPAPGSSRPEGLQVRAGAAGSARIRDLRELLGRYLGVPTPTGSAASGDELLFSVLGGRTEAALSSAGDVLSGVVTSDVTGLSFLGGIVEISGLHSRVTLGWPDLASRPEVAHGVEVGAVTVLGVPAQITDHGLEMGGTTVPAPVAATVSELLAERGGRFTVGVTEEGDGHRRVVGLLFDFLGEVQPGEIDHAQLAFGSAGLDYSGELIGSGLADFGGAEPAYPTYGQDGVTPEGSRLGTGDLAADGELAAVGDLGFAKVPGGGDLGLVAAELASPTLPSAPADPGAAVIGRASAVPASVSPTAAVEAVAAATARAPAVLFVLLAGALAWLAILAAGASGLITPSGSRTGGPEEG